MTRDGCAAWQGGSGCGTNSRHLSSHCVPTGALAVCTGGCSLGVCPNAMCGAESGSGHGPLTAENRSLSLGSPYPLIPMVHSLHLWVLLGPWNFRPFWAFVFRRPLHRVPVVMSPPIALCAKWREYYFPSFKKLPLCLGVELELRGNRGMIHGWGRHTQRLWESTCYHTPPLNPRLWLLSTPGLHPCKFP